MLYLAFHVVTAVINILLTLCAGLLYRRDEWVSAAIPSASARVWFGLPAQGEQDSDFWQALWCQSQQLSDRPFGVRVCSFLTGPLVSESPTFWWDLGPHTLWLSDGTWGLTPCDFLMGLRASHPVTYSCSVYQSWSKLMGHGPLRNTVKCMVMLIKHECACVKQKGPCLEQLWMLLHHALRGCTWQTTCVSAQVAALLPNTPSHQHCLWAKICVFRHTPTRVHRCGNQLSHLCLHRWNILCCGNILTWLFLFCVLNSWSLWAQAWYSGMLPWALLISLGPSLVWWYVAISTADPFGTRVRMVVCGHKPVSDQKIALLHLWSRSQW